MNPQRLLLGAGLLVSLGLCTAALTSAGAPSPTPATATLAPSTWEVDATHSTALFKVKHMGASWFYGRFNGISGQIESDPEDPGASSVLIRIDTNSVDTKTKGLDDHLKSPDFFDSAQFPELLFESESVKKGKEKNTLEVKGKLTLHGVTKPLTVTVEQVGSGDGPRGGKVAGFHTVFTIDRTEFGISYGAPDAVGKDVEITVSIEAKQS